MAPFSRLVSLRALLASGLLASGMVAASNPATAQSQSDMLADFLACDGLSFARERLACYDAALKQYKVRMGLTQDDVARAPVRLPSAATSGAVNPGPAAPGQARRSPGAVAAPSVAQVPLRDELENFGLPKEEAPREEVESITATVVRVQKNRLGHTFMELDNGSVWTDDADGRRVVSLEEGDTVEISKGTFGGFRLKVSDQGRLADVRRVR